MMRSVPEIRFESSLAREICSFCSSGFAVSKPFFYGHLNDAKICTGCIRDCFLSLVDDKVMEYEIQRKNEKLELKRASNK